MRNVCVRERDWVKEARTTEKQKRPNTERRERR